MRLNYPLFMAQQDTDSIFKNLAKKKPSRKRFYGRNNIQIVLRGALSNYC